MLKNELFACACILWSFIAHARMPSETAAGCPRGQRVLLYLVSSISRTFNHHLLYMFMFSLIINQSFVRTHDKFWHWFLMLGPFFCSLSTTYLVFFNYPQMSVVLKKIKHLFSGWCNLTVKIVSIDPKDPFFFLTSFCWFRGPRVIVLIPRNYTRILF